jgi:hypothetical protein
VDSRLIQVFIELDSSKILLGGVVADLSIKTALTIGENAALKPVRALVVSNVVAKMESLNCYRL